MVFPFAVGSRPSNTMALTKNGLAQEKLSRVSEAVLYVVANASRSIYVKAVGLLRGESSSSSSDADKQ